MRSHGIVRYVADHALEEAEEVDREIRVHEEQLAELRELAKVLRDLHATAQRYAQPIALIGKESAA